MNCIYVYICCICVYVNCILYCTYVFFLERERLFCKNTYMRETMIK